MECVDYRPREQSQWKAWWTGHSISRAGLAGGSNGSQQVADPEISVLEMQTQGVKYGPRRLPFTYLSTVEGNTQLGAPVRVSGLAFEHHGITVQGAGVNTAEGNGYYICPWWLHTVTDR